MGGGGCGRGFPGGRGADKIKWEGVCRGRNCLGQGKAVEFRRGCLLMGLAQGKAVGCWLDGPHLFGGKVT